MDDQRTDGERGGMSDTIERKRFRFSLKTLLFLMTLIAVGIGAYLVGQVSGYQGGFKNGTREGIHWARNNPEKN
jgi:hypothetical protein